MATNTVEAVEEPKVVEKSTPKKPQQRSYFNTKKLNRVLLDDGLSYIEHKLIDEGTFEAFQDLTSQVKVDNVNNNTEVDLGLGRTRKFLLENLVVGWNLVDGEGDIIPFSYKSLMELPPNIISKVTEDIYTTNPILSGDQESGKETTKN